MTLKHALRTALAFLSVSSALSGPALAQQVWRIASNDNMTVDERVALVDSWRWQWRFDAASRFNMLRTSRNALLGREVIGRDGQVVGQIVNDARFVNGDLAGVEVALGNDRNVWIQTPDLRLNTRDGILFTRLSPQQSEDRSRVASNNPFPRA
jgi:hypothetical protein